MLRIFLILNLFASCLFAKQEKRPVFSYPKELEIAMDAAREAGSILLQYWNQGFDPETEMQGTIPVTIADIQSNKAICRKLLMAFPEYGFLTKISGASLKKAETEWTWVVDPLDGTKSFIAGQKDFGVHIALLHNGAPVLGVNFYPVAKKMYLAVEKCGAYKQVRNGPLKRLKVEGNAQAIRPVVSSRTTPFVRSFYTALLGIPLTPKMLRKDFKSVGSCGLRLCMIAEGSRNIYASIGEDESIWHYASSSVILKEAGGFISDSQGKPLDFLSENYKFNAGTIASGSKALFERAKLLLKN